jgi:hypothetical protein
MTTTPSDDNPQSLGDRVYEIFSKHPEFVEAAQKVNAISVDQEKTTSDRAWEIYRDLIKVEAGSVAAPDHIPFESFAAHSFRAVRIFDKVANLPIEE